MRKNNTAIIFGGLFFSCSVMAGTGTLAPTVVPMANGGQASIAISNTSPNLFTVPGDRIIAVNSLDGALTNIAGESNIFADWAASRQGCTVGGKSDSVRDKASDKDKERVTKNINIMWNALSKNRMFDDEEDYRGPSI